MTERYADPAYMAQDPGEIDAWGDILIEEGVTSYLEIGSKYGGSLWRVASRLPKGSRVVSVDMPRGTGAWHETEPSLKACIDALRRAAIDAVVVWGDSTNPMTVSAVRERGPYDAILIDANHTTPYVTKDWLHYRPMATKLIAFHDISWKRPQGRGGTPINVPDVWGRLKGEFPRHRELRFHPSGQDCGIGVLWL